MKYLLQKSSLFLFFCFFVTMFIVRENRVFGINPYKQATDPLTVILFVPFEPGSLYISELAKLDSLCILLKQINDDSYQNKIILMPFYCISEEDSIEFIGVSRAKIIQDEIINCNIFMKKKVFINDTGVLPLDIEFCKSGVQVTLISFSNKK